VWLKSGEGAVLPARLGWIAPCRLEKRSLGASAGGILDVSDATPSELTDKMAVAGDQESRSPPKDVENRSVFGKMERVFADFTLSCRPIAKCGAGF